MKIITCQPFAISLFVACSVLGTCVPLHQVAAQPTTHALGKKGDDDTNDKKDSTKPPFNGMTKAQAMKAYGEPDSVGHRDGEELWT